MTEALSNAKIRKCNEKHPMIARMEKAVHSPQIDSLLRVLVPMGYTLQFSFLITFLHYFFLCLFLCFIHFVSPPSISVSQESSTFCRYE